MSPDAKSLAYGTGALAATFAAWRWRQLATGVATLDRAGIRGRALRWGWQLRVPPEALMALAHAESNGDPANYLGDVGNERAGGASVGPIQMSRATAIAQGDVPADMSVEDYSALADEAHEALTFEWGARYFAQAYHAAGDDLTAAFTAYDGAAYAAARLAWLARAYPDRFPAAAVQPG